MDVAKIKQQTNTVKNENGRRVQKQKKNEWNRKKNITQLSVVSNSKFFFIDTNWNWNGDTQENGFYLF